MARRLVVAYLAQTGFLAVARIFACPPFQVDEEGEEGFIIYGCINIYDGKIYVGQSDLGLKERRTIHLRDSRRHPTCHFHRALAKYGQDAFRWHTIQTGLSDATVDAAEIYYIRTMMTRYLRPAGPKRRRISTTRSPNIDWRSGWNINTNARLQHIRMGNASWRTRLPISRGFGNPPKKNTSSRLRQKPTIPMTVIDGVNYKNTY